MAQCCGSKPDAAPERPAGAAGPLEWFGRMLENCHRHAVEARREGRPVVGIMCEYTPRELIMAAGAIPVCLCGGSSKTIPAAEEFLPAGLCPLIKSTFGYHALGNNPFLEMAELIVAETTCDGKKKMFELLGERRAMHVLELTQKETDPDARAHWLLELRKLRRALEERFRVEITDCKIREAIRVMNRERRLRRALAELMAAEAPPLTGRQLLTLKSSISGLAEDLAQYEAALELFAKAEPIPQAARRVRVLLTGVPVVSGAERVVEIIEERGGLIVAQENCTGLKPIVEDVDESASDPLEALAEKYFHLPCSVKTPNDGRMELLARLAGQFRPQCVIELVWQGCLTYAVEAQRVRRLAEERLGLPYLKIETDYSPSDSERIAVRVEALYETVRSA